MITQLIKREDFAGYVDISPNLDDEKLARHILHAQDVDLRSMVRDDLYFAIVANEENLYDKIINGDAISHFDGLKPVIMYYAAARLVRNLDSNITAYGMRNKLNEFSEQISTKMITMQATDYESLARVYWERTVNYFDLNKALYPLWNARVCGEARPGKRSGAIIYGVK